MMYDDYVSRDIYYSRLQTYSHGVFTAFENESSDWQNEFQIQGFLFVVDLLRTSLW
jgi:hypothetical protein